MKYEPFALSLSFDQLRMIGEKGFDGFSPNETSDFTGPDQ